MDRGRIERLQVAGVLTVLAVPLPAFAYLKSRPDLDSIVQIPTEHFYVVSATSLAALALAIAVGIASVRSRQPRTLFMAAAFLAIAGVFSTHGLTTPGVILHEFHQSISVSARLSLVLGGLFFALSAVEPPAAVGGWIGRHHGHLLAALLGILAAYVGGNLLYPPLLDWAPIGSGASRAEDWLGNGMALLAAGTLLFAAWRYYRVFSLSRLPATATLSAGLVLLAESQVSMAFGQTWRLSWWMYHVLMLLGFLIPIAGIGYAYARGGSLATIVEGLFLRDTLAKVERAFPEAIGSLIAATEAKDRYLFGHARRVCGLAVRIGEELRLPDARLRAVANGALLHDIGKLGLPDAILQKRGKLTDEEYELLKEHTVRGHHIAVQVRSLRSAAPAIRSHHERLDGSGYPDGLVGDSIPIEARIVGVADVWDALTSDRVYRKAWTPEQARALLASEAGVKLDGRCVAALFAVLDAEARPLPAVTRLYRRERRLEPEGATALVG